MEHACAVIYHDKKFMTVSFFNVTVYQDFGDRVTKHEVPELHLVLNVLYPTRSTLVIVDNNGKSEVVGHNIAR